MPWTERKSTLPKLTGSFLFWVCGVGGVVLDAVALVVAGPWLTLKYEVWVPKGRERGPFLSAAPGCAAPSFPLFLCAMGLMLYNFVALAVMQCSAMHT